MTRAQQLAVTVTCLLAAVTYAGAVTTWAMGLFVLPGVAVAALLASLLAARRMSGMAIGVVGAPRARLGGAREHLDRHRQWASRPRDTLRSRMDTDRRRPRALALARALSRRRRRRGGRRARCWVQPARFGSWPLRRRFAQRSRSAGSNGRGATGLRRRGEASRSFSCRCSSGAAAIGAVLLQAQKDPRHPALFGTGPRLPRNQAALDRPARARRRGRSARQQPPGSSRQPHTSPHTSKPAARQAAPSNRAPVRKHPSRSIWFYVLAAIVLVALVLVALIAARLLYTRLAWRRVRRRLAAGAPPDQITGAWAWTRMRLEACRLPLTVDVSPDMVVAGRAVDDVPAGVDTPLRVLAAATTKAAFSTGAVAELPRGRGCVEGGAAGRRIRHAGS